MQQYLRIVYDRENQFEEFRTVHPRKLFHLQLHKLFVVFEFHRLVAQIWLNKKEFF